MAYPTITVAVLINRVSHMLTNDATADTNLSTEIQWALEDAMNTLCFKADLPAFRKEGFITTSVGTRDYELPEDFYRIIDPGLKFLADPKWTLIWYDQQDFDRVDGDWRFQNNARPRYYTVRGRDEVSGRYILRMSPKSDDIYNMSLPYFSIPTRIATAATTDTIDKRFPPPFWRAVMFAAALQFPQYLTDSQQETYKQKYAEELLLIQQSSMPVSGRVHQNRRYRGNPLRVGATWDLTGTDILDSSGNAL